MESGYQKLKRRNKELTEAVKEAYKILTTKCPNGLPGIQEAINILGFEVWRTIE